MSGLSRIEVKDNNYKDNNYEELSTESMFNIIDLMWMYGKWKSVSGLLGWNGFIEHLSKTNQLRNILHHVPIIYSSLGQ